MLSEPFRMRRVTAVTAALSLVLGAAAHAAPTTVEVRIEGASATLFEGPLLTDGRAVQATSDPHAHRCDGRNAGAHANPGPTPTAAAADALALSGGTFDASWYPGYEDYFVERLGPDAQTASAWWGILVNGAFTGVGGCQRQLAGGDELLWAYDAFDGRPFLRLAAAATTVDVGAPLPVTVEQSSGGTDGGGAPVVAPAAGVAVAPVTTSASGVETAHPDDPATVSTAADGTATLTFATPGWHRVKATAPGFVRSNRLDVCVHAPGDDCGALPADAQLRIPPPPPPDPGPEPGPAPRIPPPAAPPPAPPSPGPPRSDPPPRIRWSMLDDRARRLRYRGSWARHGTLTRGSSGAELWVRLPAGVPALIVRRGRHGARVELRGGGRRTIRRIAAGRGSVTVIGARRKHAGTVRVRILSGKVALDGVAYRP